MKNRCLTIQEEIWDKAGQSLRLSDSAREHIESCRDCHRLRSEVAAIRAGLAKAGAVPEAPDCRSAVLERITRPQRRVWQAWSYAAAATLFVLALWLTLLRQPDRQIPVVVRKQPPAQARQMVKHAAPRPGPATGLSAPGTQPSKHKPAARKLRWRSTHRTPPFRLQAKSTPVVRPKQPASIGVTAEALGDEPFIEITVSSPARERWDDSYSYMTRNESTGSTSRGSVTQSENSTTIYMEEEPVRT